MIDANCEDLSRSLHSYFLLICKSEAFIMAENLKNRKKEKRSKNCSNFLENTTICVFFGGVFFETGIILNIPLFPSSVGQFTSNCSFIF